MIADRALEALLSRGADMAYCSARTEETREFCAEAGEFTLYRTIFDRSLSLTAFKNGRKGGIGINSFDDAAIDRAAEDCLAAAASGIADEAWALAPEASVRSFLQGAPEPDMDRFFFRLRELLDTIKARYPLVVVEQLSAEHTTERELYKNTNGAAFETLSGLYALDISFSGHEGGESSSFFDFSIVFDNLDRPFVELGTLARDLADAERQIHAEPVDGKFTGTILLHPNCFGSLLYGIAANFTSDGAILEGSSVWRDKLGQKVADERLTVSVAPLDSRIVCGERYTCEGFISEDYDLIRDGRLESFMLSLYTANKTGLPRAKNSDGCFIVKPGDRPLEEIIRGIKRGLIVGRFSGGEPGAGGDFSGVAKNSYLVRNGEIVRAVSETMISGNLADLLNSVEAISSETACDGMSALPWIAFGGVTISGK